MPDIVVVGAGPAGSTAARELALDGFDVAVLEEHAEPGLPVHCTGIVGEEVFTSFDLPRELVLKPLQRFRVFSPALDRHFDLDARPGTSTAAYILDRALLDRTLAERAREAGARFLFGARVRGVHDARDGVTLHADLDGRPVTFRARLCVLACGAMSNLPARSGIVPPRTYHRTVQATWAMPDVHEAEIFLGRTVAAGSFGYAVSLGNGTAKVGVINRGAARTGYRRLVEHALGPRALHPLTRDTYRRIPMGACRRSVNGRILAVGDAAGQTKTTTGGGIYYAMTCARLLARTVARSRRGADLRVPELTTYDRRWRQLLGLEVQAGLWMRGLFEHVTDEDVDALVALAGSPAVADLISREWSFDFHRRLLLGLARLPEVRGAVLSAAMRRVRGRRFYDYLVSVVDGRSLAGTAVEAPPG